MNPETPAAERCLLLQNDRKLVALATHQSNRPGRVHGEIT